MKKWLLHPTASRKLAKAKPSRKRQPTKGGGPGGPAAPGAAELVRHFLGSRSPGTLKSYRSDLDAFAAFLGLPSAEDAVEELVSSDGGHANLLAIRFLGAMTQSKLSSATQARRISTLRSCVSLGRLIGIVSFELEVSGPTVQRHRDTRGPEVSEVSKMLAATGEGIAGARDRALLLLAITMGLRRSELSSLCLGDYDRPRSRLLVHGKGGREVWMTVPDKTRRALEFWLCASRDLCGEQVAKTTLCDPRMPIFVRLDHGSSGDVPLTPDGVYVIIRRLGGRVGMKVNPQALRKAAITTALEALDGDVRAVHKFSRNRKINSILVYDDNRRDVAGSIAEAVAADLEAEEKKQ